MQRELIEIGSRVRVENGPRLRTTIATEEVLKDEVTARHYQAGAYDALGKRIRLGQPMDYRDYRGPWVWYIYHLGPIGIDEDGRPMRPEKAEDQYRRGAWEELAAGAAKTEERWVPVGFEESKAAALAVANGLAGEEE